MIGNNRHTLVLIALQIAAMTCIAVSTPLDDYVNEPDSHYQYEVMNVEDKVAYTVHSINMTSQKWMDDTYSDRPIWWHYLTIIVPKVIAVADTAFILVNGGRNDEVQVDDTENSLALMAVTTRTIAVVLNQVPNQPIVFPSDSSQMQRFEDYLVAWTWKEFMDNPSQPFALAHLPMTKAVVRAMDTVDDYSQTLSGQQVNKFFISGASKRGWTTYLTAAVDKRVVGMAPMVFDLLNMKKALHDHYRMLGGWSWAFTPYYRANLTGRFDDPEFDILTAIVDPLVYNDRYTMPSYNIKSSGDEFFMLDETKFYYDKLTGPNFLRVLPNSEHGMDNHRTDVIVGLRSFYLNILLATPYPKIEWTMASSSASGSIRVKMDRPPVSVTVYQARTLRDGRKDFRLSKKDPEGKRGVLHPVVWTTRNAVQITPTEYEFRAKSPCIGWRGFFMEVKFKGLLDSVLTFTTEVNIIPNTLPFPECFGLDCTGSLV